MSLTGEQRYRQAVAKDRITRQRNMRLWMADKLPFLEGSQLRQFIVAELDRAYEAGKRDAVGLITGKL